MAAVVLPACMEVGRPAHGAHLGRELAKSQLPDRIEFNEGIPRPAAENRNLAGCQLTPTGP